MEKVKVKAGDSNGYLKITSRIIDTLNNIRYLEGYYELYSGNIYIEGTCNTSYKNIIIRRLKWVFDKSEVLPINDCRDKKFFHVDVYKLAVDEDAEPFKYEKQYRGNDIKGSDIFDIKKPKKYVKYVNVKNRFKNVDDPKHTKIV